MCGVNLSFGVGLGGGGIAGFSSGGAHTISLGGFFFRGIRLGLSVWSRCFVGHWGAGAVLLLWGGTFLWPFLFGGEGFVLVGVLGWVVSCDSMEFGQFPNFIIYIFFFFLVWAQRPPQWRKCRDNEITSLYFSSCSATRAATRIYHVL